MPSIALSASCWELKFVFLDLKLMQISMAQGLMMDGWQRNPAPSSSNWPLHTSNRVKHTAAPIHPSPHPQAQANDADLVLGHCHFQNRISFKELLAHSSVFGPFNPRAANQTNELRKYSRIKTRRVTPPPPISLIDRCTLFWTPYHSVVFLQRRCAATATQHLCGIEFVAAAAACLRLFPCCVVLLLLLCVCFFSPPRFLLGAQHVFRLEKITNPIVCATFSTVLARFLPQRRFCFASRFLPSSLPLSFVSQLSLSVWHQFGECFLLL